MFFVFQYKFMANTRAKKLKTQHGGLLEFISFTFVDDQRDDHEFLENFHSISLELHSYETTIRHILNSESQRHSSDDDGYFGYALVSINFKIVGHLENVAQ
jgi:hypothetical protein